MPPPARHSLIWSHIVSFLLLFISYQKLLIVHYIAVTVVAVVDVEVANAENTHKNDDEVLSVSSVLARSIVDTPDNICASATEEEETDLNNLVSSIQDAATLLKLALEDIKLTLEGTSVTLLFVILYLEYDF